MKRIWKITWKFVAAVLLIVYVAIALLNYSVVQSYLASAASSYFSRQWGAKVRIASIEVIPWDHLTAHDLLLVDPDNDTILDAKTLRLHFRRFPYSTGNIKDGGLNIGTLNFERLYLANAYYHFASIVDTTIGKAHTNLQFIIDSYASDTPRQSHGGKTFTVNVGTVVLNHVHYRMDLPDKRSIVYPYGVQIPHMEFYDIRARIKDVHVVNEDVTARIITLSTEERSGFKVDKISGNVHVSNYEINVRNLLVETPRSHISLDALLSYDNWEVMDDYLNTVQHLAVIHQGTSVALSDVAYWAPVLWGIEAQINPCGSASGTINDLHTDGLSLSFGRASQLSVEGSVRMVEKIDSLSLDLPLLNLRFEQSDLANLRNMLPQFISPQLAQKLNQLAYLDLNATFSGGLHRQSTANINLVCGLGNLRADASATPVGNGYSLTLDAGSDGLGLSTFTSDWLSHSAFNLSSEGRIAHVKGRWDIPEAALELQLTNSVMQGHHINPAIAHATLRDSLLLVQAQCNDSLLAFTLDATADIRNDHYNADLSIPTISSQVSTLPCDISTNIKTDLYGSSLDSLNLQLHALGTHVFLENGSLDLNNIDIALRSRGPYKRLRLESDPLSATASGHLNFSDIPIIINHLASQILPTDLHLVVPPDSLSLATIADKTLSFTATWNDDGNLLRRAGSTLSIARGTRLSGSYNHRELLKLALRSDSIRLGSVLLDDLGLSSRNAGANYIVDFESQQVVVGSTELIDRLNIILGSNANHSNLELLWGDSQAPTHGDLMLHLADGHISVQRPLFYIGDTPWLLDIDSLLLSTNAHRQTANHSINLCGSGISLASGTQSIVAGISLQQRDDDHLSLDFRRFNLGRLCHVLLQDSPIDIDGLIDGHFDMYGLGSTPHFNAALSIDSCIFNRQPLGLLNLHSTWNAELNTLNLQLTNDHILASGFILLGGDEPLLDFSASFTNLQLALAAPFLASFSSRFEGSLLGNLDISGTISHPLIIGEAMVNDGAIKIDPTGVTYFFDDTISFTNNTVTLSNFYLRDTRNNLAAINGHIRYSSLDNISLLLSLSTPNFLLLDQKRGDDFYGTLLAEANATLSGTTNNLDIAVNARTNPGCSLTVPLSNLKHVKTQNYISFVSDENLASNHSNSQTVKQTDNHAINITVDLNITPDLKLNLPMDFSEIRVTVGANGSGDLHINLDRQLSPFVTGNYEFINGDLTLNLLSLVEKNFSIENGSNISFNGALPDARFDLRAVYSQRANLSTLTGSLSSIDNTQKYIQVDDIISIAGTLQEPTVKFDLRLPNADQSVEEEVFSYIDRNSERDMINQTVSLLLLGQFYNVSGSDQNSTNPASGGIGTIASSLGTIVADMVEFVDINVDYKAATDYTNQQLDFNISKDWGRWYLESTLGYGGESRELESSANNAVIDALIGYRISPLIHLFAYNRTNTNDYTRTDLPYKQGVGLKLTKDFDSWHDLFGHKNKKKKK